MIDAEQFRDHIIRPSLAYIGLNSLSAEKLLLGTCAAESAMGTYIKQENGNALGVFQMEPKTHDDIHNNYLRYHDRMRRDIFKIAGMKQHNIGTIPYDTNLMINLVYATLMARVHYYRVAEELPGNNDIEGMGSYWKRYYNTEGGKGSIEHFLITYKKHVSPIY